MELILEILAIALIDLVLSGDNAAVIGLAIKNLPVQQQKSAAYCGAAGAIFLRILFTVLATMIIHIPFLNAIGGAILLWITWRLLSADDSGETVNTSNQFWLAIGSIILADISMAFDNIMGVAGAAHGKIELVIFGLALSIPILVLGSKWLASLMNRYSIIIYLGGAVLIHTSLSMILTDPGLNLGHYLNSLGIKAISWGAAFTVLIYGIYHNYINEFLSKEATASARED